MRMVKLLSTLFFSFFYSFVFSQNNYDFDYLLVYHASFQDKSIEKIYLTNSKDNSYFTSLTLSKDSTYVYFDMIDRNREFVVSSRFDKELFFKARTVNFDCTNITSSHNPFKYKIEEYEFVNYNDTLVNGTLYHHYAIKSNKRLSYIKRKKISEYHYIVSRDSKIFLPFLAEATPYEEWKSKRNIPNGLLKILYHLNYDRKITYKLELKTFEKIEKKITVLEDCNHKK